MFLINIVEWCVEFLILGMAFFFFALGTLISLCVISILKQWIDGKISEHYNGDK